MPTIEWTQREIELLLGMIEAASISGTILEEMAELKRKLKAWDGHRKTD